MSEKCVECGKSVYHAERQLLDGKPYHFLCLGKKSEREKKAPVFALHEEINCNKNDPKYQNRERNHK